MMMVQMDHSANTHADYLSTCKGLGTFNTCGSHCRRTWWRMGSGCWRLGRCER